MTQITSDEAKSLVDRLGPHIHYDFTYEPVFPETRKDVCAVRRLAEDGSTYGYDTIYLIYKPQDELKHLEITNSRSTKDYLDVRKVIEEKENIVVNIGTGGSYGSKAWDKDFKYNKSDLGLK